MNRQNAFYLLVTGLSIYVLLLCLIVWKPVRAAYLGTLHGDQVILYVFLTVIFLPVSLTCTCWGNSFFKHFRSAQIIAWSLMPFALLILGAFRHFS